MSLQPRWRVSRARIIHICPYLALVAVVLLVAGAILSGSPLWELLNTLATMSALAGMIMLTGGVHLRAVQIQRQEIREQAADIRQKIEDLNDTTMMMVAAAVSDALRFHAEPDSPWRLNLIKEIADEINHDNAIALAAIEGTVLDLGQGFAEVRAELDRIRRGN